MLLQANALQIPLADESVHCVVCSPPYWGLRDYGTATWEGGEAGCDHQGPPKRTQAGFNVRYFGVEYAEDKQGELRTPFHDVCGKCGARRIDAQLGLERMPEEYVEKLVAVFREVRRVLREDGVAFVNLGDSYASVPGLNNSNLAKWAKENARGGGHRAGGEDTPRHRVPPGLKPKDLVGIPWRVAFALRADGWWLRSDIVWAKPNPMPESVTDRPTRAHEYVFLLTKSARYFWDQEAAKETSAGTGGGSFSQKTHSGRRSAISGGPESGRPPENGTRNLRSVWTIATQPYKGAHFATFPEKLVEPCVRAGTSERGACGTCGASWERVVERGPARPRADNPNPVIPYDADSGHTHGQGATTLHMERDSRTLGWQPTCSCYGTEPLPTYPDELGKDADALMREAYEVVCAEVSTKRAALLAEWSRLPAVPCTVFDPFIGSGTTGVVAQKLGRRFVGIDLKVDYLAMATRRIRDTMLGLPCL